MRPSRLGGRQLPGFLLNSMTETRQDFVVGCAKMASAPGRSWTLKLAYPAISGNQMKHLTVERHPASMSDVRICFHRRDITASDTVLLCHSNPKQMKYWRVVRSANGNRGWRNDATNLNASGSKTFITTSRRHVCCCAAGLNLIAACRYTPRLSEASDQGDHKQHDRHPKLGAERLPLPFRQRRQTPARQRLRQQSRTSRPNREDCPKLPPASSLSISATIGSRKGSTAGITDI